jgi:hypothetical protein
MAPAKSNKVVPKKPGNPGVTRRGKENSQPLIRVPGPPANRGDENFSSKRSYQGQTAVAKKSKRDFFDDDESNEGAKSQDTPQHQDPPQPEDPDARQAAGVDGEDAEDAEDGREVK